MRTRQPEPTRLVIRPIARDDNGFTVDRRSGRPGGFIVRGARPERWVRQTKFDNDEAVGYLADRLARLGVEDRAGQDRARSPVHRSPSVTSASTGSRRPRPASTSR